MSFEIGLDHAKMLVKLVETGPIKAGDLLPVGLRDTLIKHGFATRVIIDGEDSFVAATDEGKMLYCNRIVGVDTLAKAVQKRQERGELLQFAR